MAGHAAVAVLESYLVRYSGTTVVGFVAMAALNTSDGLHG
jgi:hypothetical protein